MLHILWYIIIGLIVGLLARFFFPGPVPMGIIMTIVVGIVGSIIGGWLIAPLIGGTGIMGYVSALIGAVILLAIVNLFRRGRVR